MKNILLTGLPGIGKTTIIKKLITALGAQQAGGFYTQEIREKGARKGFEIETINGKKGILAHVNINSPFKVSKYGVNIKHLEGVAVKAISEAISHKKYIIIDEIGKMELYSQKFKQAVAQAFESGKPVIATITQKDTTFTKNLKVQPHTQIITITHQNRDKLVDELIPLLSS